MLGKDPNLLQQPTPPQLPNLEDTTCIPSSLEFEGNTLDLLSGPLPPAQATPPAPVVPAQAGTSRYEVLRLHAKGGLGAVFVAHDVEVGRQVALKEIQPLLDRGDARTRFLREAEITGRLEHPGIVPVYGIGRHADGRPYYAMRFVQGETLRDAILSYHAPVNQSGDAAARNMEFRRLVQILVSVCNAIGYAHEQGVIHRDIKPGNILLGRHAETLVVDWGLAKVISAAQEPSDPQQQQMRANLQSSVDSVGDLTMEGSVYGTPAYMSPEQAAGALDSLGAATDIYALGATLYEILVGSPSIQATDGDEAVVKVRQGDFKPPRSRNSAAPPPLEAICLKAMSREPGDRYASTQAMAADLERWLADERVLAYREPWLNSAGRWMRQHRLLATAALLSTLSLAAIGGVTWTYQESLNRSQRETDLLERALQAESDVADQERKRAASSKFFGQVNQLQERSKSQPPGWTWKHLETIPALPPGAEADDDTNLLLRNELLVALTEFDARPGQPLLQNFDGYCVALDPAGNWLAVGHNRSIAARIPIKLICLADRSRDRSRSVAQSLQYTLSTLEIDGVRSLAFSSDSKYLAVGCRSGSVHVVNLTEPEAPPLLLNGHSNHVQEVIFHNADSQLITAGLDQFVCIWDLQTGTKLHAVNVDNKIERAVVVGQLLYVARHDGGRVVDLAKGKLTGVHWPPTGDAVAALPDGSVITGVGEGLRVWQHDRLSEVEPLVDTRSNRAHDRWVFRLRLSADRRWLASLDADVVKIWDIAARKLVDEIPISNGRDIAFHPQRAELYVLANSQLVPYECQSSPTLATVAWCGTGVKRLDVSPNGEWLATSTTFLPEAGKSRGGEIQRYALDRLQAAPKIQLDVTDGPQLVLANSGQLAATEGWRNWVRLYAPGQTEPSASAKIIDPSLPVFAGEQWLWCRGDRSELIPGLVKKRGVNLLRRYDLPGLKSTFEWVNQWSALTTGSSHIDSVAAQAEILTTASQDKRLRVFQASTGKVLVDVPLTQDINQLALTSDAALIVGGDRTGTLRVWRAADGEELATQSAHLAQIDALAIAGPAEDLLVASGAKDGRIKFWQLRANRFQEIASLQASERPIQTLRLSPDGARLYFHAKDDLAVRVLDFAAFRAIANEHGRGWQDLK